MSSMKSNKAKTCQPEKFKAVPKPTTRLSGPGIETYQAGHVITCEDIHNGAIFINGEVTDSELNDERTILRRTLRQYRPPRCKKKIL